MAIGVSCVQNICLSVAPYLFIVIKSHSQELVSIFLFAYLFVQGVFLGHQLVHRILICHRIKLGDSLDPVVCGKYTFSSGAFFCRFGELVLGF